MSEIDWEPLVRRLLEPENLVHISKDKYQAAITAALDLPEFSGITQWQRGWNDAHRSVVDAMAAALGLGPHGEPDGVLEDGYQ